MVFFEYIEFSIEETDLLVNKKINAVGKFNKL